MSWWTQSAQGDENVFVVVECMLGASRSERPLPRWKNEVFERLSVMMSTASAQIMEMLRVGLTVVVEHEDRLIQKTVEWPFNKDKDGKWFLKEVRVRFPATADRAQMVRNLLANPVKGESRYTNAYRFIAVEEHPDAGGRFWITAELAYGEWKSRDGKDGKTIWTHTANVIQATTGLQQLIATYLQPPSLTALPSALRAGPCQETAQQLTSLLGNIESPKVKGEVMLPTVEDRDPARRYAVYKAALDTLLEDASPLVYQAARELDPGKYAADDKRGDRLVCSDERWLAVCRRPDPNSIPLFFVQGAAVRVVLGEAEFDAGVSKTNRHRGARVSSSRVRDSRSVNVREKGKTGLRAFYALLPVLDTEDPTIMDILEARDRRKTASESRGRGLRLDFDSVALQSGVPVPSGKRADKFLRVPLSFDRKRFERILSHRDLEIAWTKVVKKDGGWRLQITLRVPYHEPIGIRRVLGVTFGLDAIMTWALLDEHGTLLEHGTTMPNQQIERFLKEKRQVEWDQQKGRWVGGRQFDRMLDGIAHAVAGEVVALAVKHEAALVLHDIQYMQKSGTDSDNNVLFTAWAYGQLRRRAAYKAPLAGCGEPFFVHDFVVRLTCPACGAIRKKGESKDNATTWRIGNVLHCRLCGYAGTPTTLEDAARVGIEGLTYARKRWAKEVTMES